MCCPTCLLYAVCHSRTVVHTHKMAQSSMPNPHYHFCRSELSACDLNCRRCGRLVREMPRLISAHFAYGCCHRCPAYQGCDFVERHRKALQETAAAQAAQRAASEAKPGQPAMPVPAPQEASAGSAPPA